MVERSNLPVDRLTTAATGGRKAAPASSAVFAPHRGADQRDPLGAVGSQRGHGAGHIVDHPALGVVGLGARGFAVAAHVDGEHLEPRLLR